MAEPTNDDAAIARHGPTSTSIVLLGRAGVTLDVVAHTLRAAGRDVVIDLNSLERDADHRVVAVIVRPSELDWALSENIGADPVAILDDDDPTSVADAYIRGAEAVITTQSEPDDLLAAIDVVAGGGSVLPPRVGREILRQLRAITAQRPALTLTPRENDILLSIEQGESIKQTARSLGISEKTVQNLQSRLFHKLRARNRAQAVTRAHELGLLRPVSSG